MLLIFFDKKLLYKEGIIKNKRKNIFEILS